MPILQHGLQHVSLAAVIMRKLRTSRSRANCAFTQ